jgi:hypothetical protein
MSRHVVRRFRSGGRRAGALLAVLVSAPVIAVGVPSVATSAEAVVAAPTITVPPAGSHGFPYMSDTAGIAGTGYVEEEFFLGGTATAYRKSGAFGSDGKWQVTPAAEAPYKTRMLVRRPSDPAKFNGTVVVEWFNVTAQIDAPADWVMMKEELLRSGYAYVGVSVQKAGLDGNLPFFPSVKGWDPARYGTLHHPGDQYSYDILSQAGQAIRSPNGPNPLGNLKATKLIAVGQSQSGVRLTTYVNAVAPVARVFDAHLIHSNFATGAALEAAPGDTSMPNPTRIRTDLSAPTFVVLTESDVVRHSPARQPNSATVHTWELTGTSHADKWLLDVASVIAARTYGVTAPDLNCGTTVAPVNDGPGRYGVSAALASLHRWARDGARPAGAPNITIVSGQIARDPATGMALGGVRLPDVTVPTRTLSGERGTAGLGFLCGLFGAADPWNGDGDPWDQHNAEDPSDPAAKPVPEPDLGTLYRSHDDYVATVRRAASAAVRNGYLTAGDARSIVNTARTTPVVPGS